MRSTKFNKIGRVLMQAKRLGKRYRALTERPLGITGEVAEYEAARVLGLDLADAREPGYDAVGRKGNRACKFQIKGRCILTEKPGQRIGRIDPSKKWDAILLVLLNVDYELIEIHQAQRRKILQALAKPGSKARNQRGQLSVNQFKRLSRCVWPRKRPSQ